MIVDAHCDTLSAALAQGRNLWEKSASGQADLPRLLEAGVGLQVFALFVDPKTGAGKALPEALAMIDHFWAAALRGALIPIRWREDLGRLGKSAPVGGLLSLEGGEALCGNLAVLRTLFSLGVRAVGLTWNDRNELADGCAEAETRGGLTRFGKAVVAEMNRLGMIVDASHLSEAGFWDLLETCQGPVIASHSNARAICDHRRNLTDAQLAALARTGGVVGINFYPPFLTGADRATLDDVVRHAEHLAAVMGPAHVGLGSDFDGISCSPTGLEDVTRIGAVAEALAGRGFNPGAIRGIMGGNFWRVFEAVLPPASGPRLGILPSHTDGL